MNFGIIILNQFIGVIKDELGGKITIEFVALRPKAQPYLTYNGNNVKKTKGAKKFVIKRILFI